MSCCAFSANFAATADIFDMGERGFVDITRDTAYSPKTVSIMRQDSQGFMWIGTNNALLRYDGHEFAVPRIGQDEVSDLTGIFVTTMWISPSDDLWIGTQSSGVARYNPRQGSVSTFRSKEETANSLSSNSVYALAGDEWGRMFVASEGGLDLIDANANDVMRLASIKGCAYSTGNARLRSLLWDGDKTLWIGSRSGLCRVEIPLPNETNYEERLRSLEGWEFTAFNDQNIYQLFKAQSGDIWVGTTDHGAAFFHPEKRQVVRIPYQPNAENSAPDPWVVSITQPNSKEIWLATTNGLAMVDSESGKVNAVAKSNIGVATSLNANDISALFTDRSGLTWIGTWGGGINLYNPLSEAFRYINGSAEQNAAIAAKDILSILELESGEVWLAPAHGSIQILDPKTRSWNSLDVPDELENSAVRDMLQAADKNVWIGGYPYGLQKFDPETRKLLGSYSLGGADILSIAEYPQGSFWIGTEDGLYLLDEQHGKSELIGSSYKNFELLVNTSVMEVLVGGDELLWLKTPEGLYALSVRAKTVRQISTASGSAVNLSNDAINDLLIASSGDLYVATRSGLDRFVSLDDEATVFESMHQIVGSKPRTWGSIKEDSQGRIWSLGGWLDPSTGQYRDFDASDGFDLDKVWDAANVRSGSRTLLFGGYQQVFMIKPERAATWGFEPALGVVDVRVDNATVPYGGELILDSDVSSFSVEFTALDFLSSSSVIYEYKLEGFDKGWTSTTAKNRHATYTNVPGGDYVLAVRSTNSAGIWTDSMLRIPVTKIPAWWEMASVRVVLVALFFLSLYAFYKRRVNALRRQKVLLDALVASRTSNISMLGVIGMEVAATSSIQEILDAIIVYLDKVISRSTFIIAVSDDETGLLDCHCVAPDSSKSRYNVGLSETELASVSCVSSRQEIHINQWSEATKIGVLRKEPAVPSAMESAIFVPLIVAQDTLGCVAIISPVPFAYSDNDKQIFQTIASYTAIAVANFSLIEIAESGREVARAAAQAKADFLANMSHEIRTPLNAIIGMSYLAMETNLDRRQSGYISKVHKAAQGLLGIVNDTLDFSKIDAQKLSLESADFNLLDVFENVSNLVGLKAKEKGLELLYDFAKDVPTYLVGDALRLGQVLTNLGGNAVKFTDRGEVVTRVSNVHESTAECMLRFDVIDSGIGISEENQRRLFQSFSQADTSTTRKYGGTGLGLAISKSLVEMMGGAITVKSVEGEGSTFSFTATFAKQANKTELVFSQSLRDLRLERVLVVDDNSCARDIMVNMLDHLGVVADHASSGRSALEMIQAKPAHESYQLVLMDWQMPDPDGLRTVQEMQSTVLPAPPVILVTGYGREEAKKAAGDLRIADFLTKPVTPSLLHDSIAFALDRATVTVDSQQERQQSYSKYLANLRGARILLVEDNLLNQELAAELLGREGIQITLANNGQEALDLLQVNAFDGVLMDCQMPVLDGYEATKRLRMDPRHKDLPIIAMTANAMAEEREKVIEAGMNDHISKPLDIELLFATIAKWISSGHSPLDTTQFGKINTAALIAPHIDSLPDLDIESGLAVCMNDPVFYRRILMRFMQGQQNFVAEYTTALEAGDYRLSERLAHTLKGVAGNIGAKQVQTVAEELEQASESMNTDGHSELVDRMQLVLSAALIRIKAYLSERTDESARTLRAPDDKARKLLAELQQCLKDDDTSATVLIEQLLELQMQQVDPLLLRRLAAAVEAFDFERALKELDRVWEAMD